MTYTHITYPTGEEFLFDHGAMDDGQVCHGDLLAMNLRGQWESADNTPVVIHTGNENTGEGVDPFILISLLYHKQGGHKPKELEKLKLS